MNQLAFVLLTGATLAYSAELFHSDKVQPAAAAGMNAARLAKIPVAMKNFVDQGTAAGFVTLVARHGRVASLEAVGYQDREAKIPMQTDSLFAIKSLTKPITVAGLMILADEARLSLLDPVERYLPEYKGIKLNPCGTVRQGNCDPVNPSHLVTIRDLMTHTSGLRDPSGAPAQPFATLADRITAGAHTALITEPGAAWRYSNLGFATLGRLIEVVSGQPYDTFMAERLFQPLGMKDTHFVLPRGKESRLAAVYTLDANGKLTRVADAPAAGPKAAIPAPEGGLFSTAADQARFYQMLLSKGTLDGRRILSIPAVEAMTTNQTGDLKAVEFSPGLGMGFGFGIVKEALGTFRYQTIGTFMKGGAYRTFAWGDPARDLLGIVMFQRTNGGGDMAPEITAFVTLAEAAVAE